MVVKNGSKPVNGAQCPHGFNSRLILTCHPAAIWPDNGDVSKFTKVFYIPGDDPCQVRCILETIYFFA